MKRNHPGVSAVASRTLSVNQVTVIDEICYNFVNVI